MKILTILISIILTYPPIQAQTTPIPPTLAQTSSQAPLSQTDTLINIGTYKLHFIILKAKGQTKTKDASGPPIPILFEAGGGEDASPGTSSSTTTPP